MATMIRINLLDWREARREQRQRNFFLALGLSAAAAVGLVALVMFGYGKAIDTQEARNQLLQDQITKFEKQIQEIKDLKETRQSLIKRMEIIERLQKSRSRSVHYFEQIVTTVPEGVFLTSLKQNGDKTTVTGLAQSNGRISRYMRNIDKSEWFAQPRLVVIKSHSKDRRRLANFTLTFKTVTPDSKN